MAPRRTTLTALTAGAALALTAVVAGALPGTAGRPGAVASVRPADDLPPATGCEALRRWYVRAALPEVGPWGLSGPPVLYDGTTRTPQRSTPAVEPSPTGSSVQEGGVDESDVAETDGRLLVRVLGRTLVVTDVSRDRLRELSRTTLPGDWSVEPEVLLRGHRVLVVAAAPDSSAMAPLRHPAGPQTNREAARGEARTRVLSFDLADPRAPRLTDDRTLAGRLVSTWEFADGTVRVAVTGRLPRIAFVRPGGGRSPAEATAENRRRVRAAPVTAWLPTVQAGGTLRPLSGCSAVRHPQQPSGLGTLSVVSFPFDHPDRFSATSLVTEGDLLSSSARRLYVATVADGRTTVAAFALDGPRTSYVGSGSVPGVVASSMSLSERGGLLRVASSTAAATTVTVLAERRGALVEAGSIPRIGRGGRLTAVRWLGDLAVLVTNRATDQLWTVDLADPLHPRLLGARRAPGYTSYLHPVGDGLLVGLGQVALAADGTSGQAATFDLTDPRAVTRPSSVRLGTDTTVDTRSVSYLPAQRTLLVAVSSWSSGASRFVALHVAADGRLTRTVGWSARGTGSELRALPLGGGRVALVGEGVRVVHIG